jgi:hypothetical protein
MEIIHAMNKFAFPRHMTGALKKRLNTMPAVHFMEGGEPLPWWWLTQERKKANCAAKR